MTFPKDRTTDSRHVLASVLAAAGFEGRWAAPAEMKAQLLNEFIFCGR